MGEERRITDLTEISAFRANDYIAVDNASEAQTKKLPATAITNSISAAQTDATRALNIARSTSSFPTGDAYSSSSAYKVGDMVIYNNTLYRCKTACSAASWSVNANNFEAISLASALTDVNNDLSDKIKFKDFSIGVNLPSLRALHYNLDSDTTLAPIQDKIFAARVIGSPTDESVTSQFICSVSSKINGTGIYINILNIFEGANINATLYIRVYYYTE
jgi:hypothetical protein